MTTQLENGIAGDGISDVTLDFLLAVIRSNEKCSTRLAALSVLTDLFKSDRNCSLLITSIKNGLVTYLKDGLDLCSNKCRKPPDLCDILFSDLSMRVFHKISQMSFSQQQSIIEENVISRLIEYLNINSNFYRLFDNSTYNVYSQIENKLLVGRMKKEALNPELLTRLMNKTGGYLEGITLPSHLCVCEVIDTTCDNMDLSIKEFLTDNEIAWPELKRSKGEETNVSGDWTDMIITKNISSLYFWALIGEESILAAKEVYNMLNSIDEQELKHINPADGDLVVTKGCLGDKKCLLRCEVTKHCGSVVNVFSVDYGLTYSVPCHDIYRVPEDIQLSSSSRNVSLCRYSDVQVPPMELDTVIYAAATLANICRYSVVAGEITMNLSGVDTFLPLLLCPEPELLHHLVNILNTLACNGRIYDKLRNIKDLVPSLVDVLNKTEEFNDMYLLKDTLNCLSNLLYKSEKCRRDFYDAQGLRIALMLLTQPYIDNTITKAILKLMKIFLNSYPENCGVENFSKSGSSRFDYKTNQGVKQKDSGSGPLQNQSSSSKQPDTDFICGKPKEETVYHKMSHEENSIKSCERTVPSEKEKVKAVNTAEVYLADNMKGKYFIKDSVVDFQPGMAVEFRPNKTLKSISASVTARVVCGMLNSGKGGHIYFGIGQNSEVAGVEANRNDRDEFRIGLDIMMNNQLSPPVLHSLFHIDYFPVVRRTRGSELMEMVPVENLHIIDITVHLCRESIFTCKDNLSYFRFGPSTYPLSVQEVRQLITVDEESKYIEEICKLRRELSNLKLSS